MRPQTPTQPQTQALSPSPNNIQTLTLSQSPARSNSPLSQAPIAKEVFDDIDDMIGWVEVSEDQPKRTSSNRPGGPGVTLPLLLPSSLPLFL